MVQGRYLDAGYLLDHRFHERAEPFRSDESALASTGRPLFGQERFGQMVLGRAQRKELDVKLKTLQALSPWVFCRGRFQLSTDTANPRPNPTISVDKDKAHENEQEIKENIRHFGQSATENVGERTRKVREPERRP
jgi:hypothetical protein